MTLTGVVFGWGEQAPTYRGAPDEDAPYVWVCDGFYKAGDGGSGTEIDGWMIHVAFDTPLPRGFDAREQALSAAKEHVRAQFARVGVPTDKMRVEVVRPEEEGTPEAEQPVPTDRSAGEDSPGGDALH